MKLLFLQHGDYREAFHRLQAGEAETYADQRRSISFVASLAERYAVTVVAMRKDAHDETLVPNLRSIGVPADQCYRRPVIGRLLDELEPDLMVLRAPHLHALLWARRRRVRTLLCFADLFKNRGAKAILRNLRLRLALDRQIFPCVANHNLNASLSVAKALLYPKTRIVPWEANRMTAAPTLRAGPAAQDEINVFFAGALIAAKGIEDCLQAAVHLKARGVKAVFSFAGRGDLTIWRQRAEALGVADRIWLLGLIPNEEVQSRMGAADIIVVPSRHEYAEGMPRTIYEALASRTPLIVSDHPAFADRLQDGEQCLMFPAGESSALADRIKRLARDRALYARLSQASAATLESLYFGIEWDRLVRFFLDDPDNRTDWVQAHSLAALAR